MIKLTAGISKDINKMKQDARNIYGLRHRLSLLEREYKKKCEGKEISEECTLLVEQIERVKKKLESLINSNQKEEKKTKPKKQKSKKKQSNFGGSKGQNISYNGRKARNRRELIKGLEEKISLLKEQISALMLELRVLEMKLIKAEKMKKRICRDYIMETIKEESDESEDLLDFIINEASFKIEDE
ncbi:uncharacterized protein CMU_030760 [Cryptosporidium muris RN66]|uniref:Uncharacterized protein n=1 Tax=Cryptosporidium muris (strain RN66) TaxID=441375 RepID=B6AK37_CRYMR|nr:uncharacterized protein CMU_030760 [Cryptosporidium muris RN66]EEA08578.1 hypothetical protein CMU_030760 [Cryptosporidium muris RN66]|eukprot:XP_002142927.1 hypothetical protein [Cryptosporidium muris RN66]